MTPVLETPRRQTWQPSARPSPQHLLTHPPTHHLALCARALAHAPRAFADGGGAVSDWGGQEGPLWRLSPLPADPEFYFDHFDHNDGITDLFNTIQ
jgi:hypothetical protein